MNGRCIRAPSDRRSGTSCRVVCYSSIATAVACRCEERHAQRTGLLEVARTARWTRPRRDRHRHLQRRRASAHNTGRNGTFRARGRSDRRLPLRDLLGLLRRPFRAFERALGFGSRASQLDVAESSNSSAYACGRRRLYRVTASSYASARSGRSFCHVTSLGLSTQRKDCRAYSGCGMSLSNTPKS
jgi:hypothetical protein